MKQPPSGKWEELAQGLLETQFIQIQASCHDNNKCVFKIFYQSSLFISDSNLQQLYHCLLQSTAKLCVLNFGWPLNRDKDAIKKTSLGRPKGKCCRFTEMTTL